MGAPEFESDALILTSRDHGESDRILTIYSNENGKFSAIAKGANRSKRRFVNKLEPFSFLRITYQNSKGRGLAFLKEAELHASFINLRQNYSRYATASVMQEILLQSIGEKEQDHQIFKLTLWAFHSLDTGKPPRDTLFFYLIRLFDLLGYRPGLSACLNCGTATGATTSFSFNYSTGGLVCANCTSIDYSTQTTLSHGTINILNKALELPMEQLHRLKLSTIAQKEAGQLLHRYTRTLLQRELQSWKIFETVSS